MTPRPSARAFLLVAALVAVATLAGLFAFKGGLFRHAKESAPDKLYAIKRGDLVIGVQLTGNVNAKNKYKLSLEAPFPTKLIYIVDENAKVAKGDVVMKFETEELQLKIDELKLELESAEKELSIAKEEQSIQASACEAEVRAAEDAVVEANDEFNKYWKLQGPKDRDAQTAAVEDAKKTKNDSYDAYNSANDDYTGTVYTSEEDESKAKAKVTTAKEKLESDAIKYNNALIDRKIFKRYTFPNKITELKNKCEQAKLELNKAKTRAGAILAQKESAMRKVEANLQKVQHDLEKHESYLPMMQVVAPVDGIVTYGDPDRRWGNPEIKVGMEVKRKEVLVTIPDMSKMIVDVSLPEQYRSRVKSEDPVVVTPDSLPNLKINGKVDTIAALPVNQIFWDSSSPKIYRTTVDLDQDDSRLVSGMSVQVEVISQKLKDVLFVPIESVFDEEGKYFVYVKTAANPKTAFVDIGMANANFVEIRSGLKEGDEVYLYKPFQSSKSN